MFENEQLKNHLETKSSIKTRSAIVAEWNMNVGNNIDKIGNYRYRPLEGVTSKFGIPNDSYDPNDLGYFYTNATDADIVLDGTYDENDSLTLLKTTKEREASLFSLESCFERFRPRSGINKARYGVNSKYLNYSNVDMASRPRYYMADKNDKFKYWSSFRSEAIYKYTDINQSVSYGPNPNFVKSDGSMGSGELSGSRERGIASQKRNSQNYIDDAAPFVVYKEDIPTNRIVVKMQTNVGSVRLNDLLTPLGTIQDPFFGDENKTTPVRWKIQYLSGSSWVDAISFDENSTRLDGSGIVKDDGYVELAYGLVIPEKFQNNFKLVARLSSNSMLPEIAQDGEAFLVAENLQDIGRLYIWNNSGFENPFTPEYKWQVHDEQISKYSYFLTELVNPDSFISSSGQPQYREFSYIRGLRIVVETMNKSGSPFDLIELSPRLSVDLSYMTVSYSITKQASDLGISGMPVGQLLAATGTLQLADYEQAFNLNNINSIIRKYYNQHVQFKIYEIVEDVDGVDYFVPLKTMYSDSFPKIEGQERRVSFDLRDMMFYLESHSAPELLVPNVSLSYAISTLLDYIGFSNYTFKRVSSEEEPIIPFFFVDPSLTLAEVLQQLAVSTQTAMFFDEYNNFVMMTKEYMMPEESARKTDIVLYGSKDMTKDGAIKNQTVAPLANIIDLAKQDKLVYNAGKIMYTSRYIQKSTSRIEETYLLDRERRWIYKPSLLWEVSATANQKAKNEQTTTSDAFALSAIPLNSNISSEPPSVVNHQVVNNIIDLGEAVYWLGRYNGYFFANGEIIRFDAQEYSVPGVANQVWITSISDYQNYFSKIPFNGKMYPTGRVRIYTEPDYETIDQVTRLKNGPIKNHGRAQFGTKAVSHFAGIDPYWTSADNVRGVSIESRFLFSSPDFNPEVKNVSIAGSKFAGADSNDKAKRSQRSDVIKNFLSSDYYFETDNISSKNPKMVQASALVFEGPGFSNEESPNNFLSYVTKKVSDSQNVFKHFGTRMRVIGKIEADSTNWQTPAGSSTIYNISSSNPEDVANIDGGGGGIAVLLNPKTNAGYYLEVIAMNNENLEKFDDYDIDVHNVFFYKIVKQDTNDQLAAPIKLWSGLSDILVDNGLSTGRERLYASDVQTVYDLAVEYENIGATRRFYIYLNGTQVATVDDRDPSPEDEHDNMALFVRGASRCMFENIYALRNNYSKGASMAIKPVISNTFASEQINESESFSKYAISGLIQSTYLSGLSPSAVPQYDIYYDEFGTIMREAAYFNIKYDKTYPALYAKIATRPSRLRGYTISGFFAGAYGAEFLIFNNTDTTLILDSAQGNALRIQGIAFTQNSKHELNVDEYFNRKTSLSSPKFLTNQTVESPEISLKEYQDIKLSRMNYGTREFNLDADYIQDRDSANKLMSWLTEKIMKPRESIGIKIFANPTIQLGDIVEVDYKFSDIDDLISEKKRFVVYNIEYSKSYSGPDMTLYLSEV